MTTTSITPAEAMAELTAEAIRRDSEFLPALRNAVARAERTGCRRCGGGPGMLHWIGSRGADLGACHRCEGTGSGLTGCQNRLALVESRIAAWSGDAPDSVVTFARWQRWISINREAHSEIAKACGSYVYKAHLDLNTAHFAPSDLHKALVEAVGSGRQVGPVRPATFEALVAEVEAITSETVGV